jgi:cardiolipin synthase (CMP-forming)
MTIWPHIPNMLTVVRILLVPLTVYTLSHGDYLFAFFAFLTAGITDGVDGYMARRFKLQTELGAYLDPLADKFLLVSVFVTLALLKVLPPWVAILAVTRDVLIVSAVMLARVLDKPVTIKPVMISKINTAAQICLAVGLLASLAFGEINAKLLQVANLTVAFLTVASGAVYMAMWFRHMAEETRGEEL